MSWPGTSAARTPGSPSRGPAFDSRRPQQRATAAVVHSWTTTAVPAGRSATSSETGVAGTPESEVDPVTAGERTRRAPPSAALPGRNEVFLVGRVSGAPQERTLPSGDSIVAWRVVVDRVLPPRPPPGVRPATVDTFDCVAWTAAMRRSARALTDGDVIEVEAALRRRFWRAGAGAVSRYELEVSRVRRVRRRSA